MMITVVMITMTMISDDDHDDDGGCALPDTLTVSQLGEAHHDLPWALEAGATVHAPFVVKCQHVALAPTEQQHQPHQQRQFAR